MTKTFYITYWASKHKKHITRQGKHDEKSRYGVAKKGVPYYVYYDLDAHGYRTATYKLESEVLMPIEIKVLIMFMIVVCVWQMARKK